MKWSAAAAILLSVAVVSLAFNSYQYSSPKSVTVTVTTTKVDATTLTASATCVISGQPEGILFRALSDSTLMPVPGISVSAVNTPFLCNGSPATTQTVESFTTNGTEWLPLPNDNNYVYAFVANYLGHTYNFTAHLEPVSLTCATLFVPSGRTNVTITEFGEACS